MLIIPFTIIGPDGSSQPSGLLWPTLWLAAIADQGIEGALCMPEFITSTTPEARVFGGVIFVLILGLLMGLIGYTTGESCKGRPRRGWAAASVLCCCLIMGSTLMSAPLLAATRGYFSGIASTCNLPRDVMLAIVDPVERTSTRWCAPSVIYPSSSQPRTSTRSVATAIAADSRPRPGVRASSANSRWISAARL